MHTPLPILAVTLALSSTALAQDLTHKAPPQAKPIALVNVTLHPISRPPIEHATIVFSNGIISDITQEHIVPTEDWDVRKMNGEHVYPGFISCYTQLGLTEIQSVPATNDLSEVGSLTPEVRATIAVNPDSTLIPVTRSNGVLLAGVFPQGGTIAGQGGAIRLDGWTIEDMTIDDNVGILLRWPNVRPITAWWMDRSEEDQLKDIKENLATIERAFDAAQAYDTLRSAEPTSPVDLRWEAMRSVLPVPEAAAPAENTTNATTKPKRRTQRPVFITAQDIDQINSAVQFAAQRKLKVVLVGGRDAPLAAPLLKEHNIPVILQGVHNMPRRDDSPYDEAFTLAKRLADAGLTFAIANADDTAHERNLPYTTATAVAHGLPRDEALKAITLNAAQVLGIDDRYGSLELGKSATLIITDEDPLEITTSTLAAFIDGKQIDLSNKQTKLTEKYVDRYKQSGELK